MKLLNYALFIALTSMSSTLAFAEQYGTDPASSYGSPQQNGSPADDMSNAEGNSGLNGQDPSSQDSDSTTQKPDNSQSDQQAMQDKQDGALKADEIEDVQEALKDKGYPVDIDGVFGKKTAEAVRQFQTDNNIAATGALDDQTLAMLDVQVENDDAQGSR